MDRIKCATFDKEMQDSIPPDIREKMKADRAKAEKEQETKAKTLPIQNVSQRSELLKVLGKHISEQYDINEKGFR